MININLNASTAKELNVMLDTLEKRGLINKLSTVEPEEVNAPIKQQPTPAQQPVQQPAPFQPVQQPTPVQQPVQPLPTTAPSYTLEQLSLAAARGLMDTGRQAELMQLLAKYGIQALTQLSKAQYGAFATDLRALGCKI